MKPFFRFLGLAGSLLLASCASTPDVMPKPIAQASAPVALAAPHTLILISIDGFRADYLDRGATPYLKSLYEHGARGSMRPSFPSLTFPNHYALVTGKVPDHNGIVDNTLRDEARPGVVFKMSNLPEVHDRFWWDDAEPFWVTAEKSGIKTATMFWPGSEAEIHGVRPSFWKPFDYGMKSNPRVRQVLSWLDLPEGQRPKALTLYFDAVDTAGHDYGPEAPETTKAIAEVDAAIGELMDGLKARGLYRDTNIIVVADHGMANVSKDRGIWLEDSLADVDYDVVMSGSVMGLNPVKGHEAAIDAALISKSPAHMKCWHKGQIPARFRYGTHRRIPEIICSAEVGWIIRAHRSEGIGYKAGAHGFDNQAPEMAAVFVAEGPDIAEGVTLDRFDNVDIYDLVMDLLSLPPQPNDGDLGPVKSALKSN